MSEDQRAAAARSDRMWGAFLVAVDERCTACGACLVTCPERALLAAPLRPRSVDSRCTGCLACIEICPRDALTVTAAPHPAQLGSVSSVMALPTEPSSRRSA